MPAAPVPPPEPGGADGRDGRGFLVLAPGVAVPPGAVAEQAVRSGGPGGQNVNKVSTKIVLTIQREALLEALPPHARVRLAALAGSRWSASGLVIASSESRSQAGNRRAARERVRGLLVEAMHRPARRLRVKPGRRANQRRVEAKRRRGDRKRDRGGSVDA